MWFDIQTNLTDILRKKICRKKIVTILIMTIALFFPLEFRTKIKMTDFITLIHHCTRSSKQVQKRPWRKRKRDWMGVFIVFRGQSWVRVPTHWQELVWFGPPIRVSKEGEPWLCFQSHLPRCGAEARKEGWGWTTVKTSTYALKLFITSHFLSPIPWMLPVYRS